MKTYKFFIGFFLLVMFLICRSADMPPQSKIQINQSGTPKDFISSIYAIYLNNGQAINIGDSQTDILLSPALVQIIHHDNELTQGEVGFLDADPICDYCQDFDQFKVLKIVTQDQKSDQAIVNVLFRNGDRKSTVTFSVLKIKGLWYINDIHTARVPSMRAGLEREIKDLSSK